MINVSLSWDEIVSVGGAGFMRNVKHITEGFADSNNVNPVAGWGNSIEGTLAEYALSKAFNVRWSGLEHKGADDVADIEVKQTHLSNGRLLVRPNKLCDTTRYFLVIGLNGNYSIIGWQWGLFIRHNGHKAQPQRGRKCWGLYQNQLIEVYPGSSLYDC